MENLMVKADVMQVDQMKWELGGKGSFSQIQLFEKVQTGKVIHPGCG